MTYETDPMIVSDKDADWNDISDIVKCNYNLQLLIIDKNIGKKDNKIR